MPIRLLSPHLVNQIAAGEVVDRPASVVKELVENALDAGATRIRVAIEGGGCDLIEVSDDGAGIPFDELPLAVAAHATSKIERPEDLEAISTLGFRGEALASIASVSRFTITSRTRGQDAAGVIEVDGGVGAAPKPAAGPHGTAVRVRTLFFNTPARRKFLRSEPTEAGRVTDLVETIAMTRPGVGFRLMNGSRSVLDLAPTDDPRRRLLDILGRDLVGDLLDVSDDAEIDPGSRVSIWGVVGTPSTSRPTARHQRLFMNGRPIVDRSLLHAIKEAYRGLIDPGRFPVAILAIELDPRQVDVNVHPAKSEVRFRQPSFMHQFVHRAVRSSLRGSELIPSIPLGVAAESILPTFDPSPPPLALTRPRSAPLQPSYAPDPPPPAPIPSTVLAPLPRILAAAEVLQVHKSFLVLQDPQGILIVDQHALHERVMFEDLLARVAAQPLERQALLTPAIIDAGSRTIERLEELAPTLERLGFNAAPAGPRSIAVHAVPTFLASRRVDAVEFLRELLQSDEGALAGADAEAVLKRVLDMMACKAAVKAGDRLTPAEIAALLASRERIERSTNCPHGRPTTLRLSIADLEKHFGRR